MQLFRKNPVRDILVLVTMSLLPRVVYYFYNLISEGGLPQAHDTQWYLEHAQLLISQRHIDFDFNGVFYLSYYSLLALLLLIFKTPAAVVFVQMLINAFSVILAYKITLMLFNRRTAVITGMIYAFLWPMIFWSIYIITDSLFISLLLLQVYFLLKAFEERKRVYGYSFFFTSLYMIFFRPTGIITLTFLCMYIIINLELKSYVNRHKAFVLCVGILAAATFLYLAGSTILSPLKESLYNNMRWLLLDNYAHGRIYDIPTPYDYSFNAVTDTNIFNNFIVSFFVNNGKHIVILYGKRIVSFVGVWVWKLNEIGMADRLKYLVPAMTGCFIAAVGLSRMIKKEIFKKSSILVFVVMSILCFTVFFFMDSAYRYRVPAFVFLGMIGAYGMDGCIEVGSKCLKR